MMLLQLYFAFLKMGFFSIGGGYVMLSLIEGNYYKAGLAVIKRFVDL